MNSNLPTADDFRSVFDYDPLTGMFRYVPTFKVWGGRAAGHLAANGYCRIRLRNRPFFAHRVAWLMTYGDWPAGEVDHINCLRSDNRISNLRIATRAQNQANIFVTRRSKSGVKGVSKRHDCNSWMAIIRVGRKKRYLGTFQNIEDASAAYLAAAKTIHGEFARG
jgi:hypothetical protein